MRILILTYGSRGDVQPYVALGQGLIAKGHEVTLAASERFREFVEACELDYGYLNDDLLSIIETDDGRALLEKGDNLFEMLRRGLKIAKQVKPAQRALLQESWDIAREIQPDFIVFHPKAGGATHIAEKLGIGCALVTPIPMLVPTCAFRFPIFPDLKLGGWYNRLTYHLIQFAINKTWRSYIRDFRKQLELPSIKKFHFLKTAYGKDVPIIHAHSEAVIPRPDDWPESARVTGYLFLDEAANWEPPQALLEFLQSGAPPVYIGFGSMAGRNPERLAHIVIEALQKAGLRGIIATGWGGLKAEDLPHTIFKIDQAPHEWIFPQMSAVVHHGGAGTTAAGLRAGKPSVIIPFFGDQPFWAKRIYKLGAGPKPIRPKKLTSDNLAQALHQATTCQTIIDGATKIGDKIRQEDGVANAAACIETLVLQRGDSTSLV